MIEQRSVMVGCLIGVMLFALFSLGVEDYMNDGENSNNMKDKRINHLSPSKSIHLQGHFT